MMMALQSPGHERNSRGAAEKKRRTRDDFYHDSLPGIFPFARQSLKNFPHDWMDGGGYETNDHLVE